VLESEAQVVPVKLPVRQLPAVMVELKLWLIVPLTVSDTELSW